MHKRTIVDQIEVTRDGTINLRFAKEIIDDDEAVISKGWHRTSLTPGHNVDAQMAAVNRHLEVQLKYPAVDSAGVERIEALAAMAWTDEVKAAYLERMVAAEEART